jgi:uncharacterized surface anchored protein
MWIGMLFNPIVWVALSLAVVLAGTHWKVYTAGKKTVQAEFTAYIAEEKVLFAAATETARLRERSINNTLRQSYDQYNTIKNSNSTDAKSASDKLQQLEAALAGTSRSCNTTTTGGADATSLIEELFISCTRSLRDMAAEADGLSARLQGLQGYVRSIK